jgi:hypothetical protein
LPRFHVNTFQACTERSLLILLHTRIFLCPCLRCIKTSRVCTYHKHKGGRLCKR